MNSRRWLHFAVVALCLAGCATPPPMPVEDESELSAETRVSTPMIEYPPIEPVEPPPVEPQVVATPSPTPTPTPKPAPAPAPPEVVAIAPPTTLPAPALPSVPPEISAEDQQTAQLLADLQRYAALPNDELRRELATVTQNLARQRTDANRVRLAMLYTLARTNPQDDQRALQLLDNVAKSGNGSPVAIKQLAAVLQTQISERVRAVRDEQQKADVAIQKLEALRNMERSLLRERVRGGGGGGGGSGGGSSGGGGGSGGSAGGN